VGRQNTTPGEGGEEGAGGGGGFPKEVSGCSIGKSELFKGKWSLSHSVGSYSGALSERRGRVWGIASGLNHPSSTSRTSARLREKDGMAIAGGGRKGKDRLTLRRGARKGTERTSQAPGVAEVSRWQNKRKVSRIK